MRWGVLIPATNTVVEQDFWRDAPQSVSVHTARMALDATTAEAERRMISDALPNAARDLARARPDLVIFSCTSAGAVAGPDGEPRMMRTISEATGAPVVSTNLAVQEALVESGGRRVAVLTAYVDELTEKIADGIKRAGLEVVVAAGLGIVDPFEICDVTPDEIVSFARKHVVPSETDTVFISCTNLRAMEAREAVERELGLPVVTSNQAALKKALAMSIKKEAV